METDAACGMTTRELMPSSHALSGILERLAAVLRQENHVLESAVETDHSQFIVAKNQALRDLMMLQRTIQLDSLPPAIEEMARELRALVDRNGQLLKLQVAALNDLTSFLTQTVISDQGDGTYTRECQ
jgi:hypothetical protein